MIIENISFTTVVFLLIITGWLIGLTAILIKTLKNYNQLTKGITQKTLSEVLRKLVDDEDRTKEKLKEASTQIVSTQKQLQQTIQKMGLVRFNPFADTGGDQSFALALMDGKNSGFVVTSLYSRNGAHWYIKHVKNGKGVEHTLSKEEQQAVDKAENL